MKMIIAVDTGGTFTDVVCLHEGELHTLKVPSTPRDPAAAVLSGVRRIIESCAAEASPFVLIHGSTVATNALLERKGGNVVLITNAGFEDVLEIGRQTRPQLYALSGWRRPPLVPAERRLGVTGRIGPRGEELEPLSAEELGRLRDAVATLCAEEGLGKRRGAGGSGGTRDPLIDSIAVCCLHSYANGAHERAIGDALAGLGVPVSLSHVVLGEYREYERCSTTVVNAYVAPLMDRYLGKLEEESGAERVRIMGSGGGAIPVALARSEPVQTVLSGPAGGVTGALSAARTAGFDRIVGFDMGGTSTDVSICPGRILHTRELVIDGLPVAIPVIDIHTVGAGGGSIAYVDAGGALRVGPRSAGAQPGPICYGRGGTEVTVTDAQVWLRRLPADAFLGGEATLDRAAIAGPLHALAQQLGSDAETAAEGVIEVVNTAMEGALRVITVERGHDPVDCTLVAFGGAAGLHAVELATRMGVARVLLPRDPGLLSAHGMLGSPVRKDAARTVLIRAEAGSDAVIARHFVELQQQVLSAMNDDGIARDDVALERTIDARYTGQSFELRVSAADWIPAFHAAHTVRYGYAQVNAGVEAVTLRVAGTAAAPQVPERPLAAAQSPAEADGTIEVHWQGGRVAAQRYSRDRLSAGHAIQGPAVLTEYSATTWLPPGYEARIDRLGNVIIEV